MYREKNGRKSTFDALQLFLYRRAKETYGEIERERERERERRGDVRMQYDRRENVRDVSPADNDTGDRCKQKKEGWKLVVHN
jgi:hypothetical protein